MASNDMSFTNLSDDWSVILQSYSPKLKKELVRRISEIFELEKKDAEQALSNTPLILLDNLSFGMAARIKNFFQKLGAVVETTNHEMIKKNCFQVLWPETPDLSFFLKEETKPAAKDLKPDAPARREESNLPAVGGSPERPKREETPGTVVHASQPSQEEPAAPQPANSGDDWGKAAKGSTTPKTSQADDGWEKLAKAPATPQSPKVDDGWEKLAKAPATSQSPKVDDNWEKLVKGPATPQTPKSSDGWEKRAKELSEKLQKFQEEKKKVNEDIVLKAVEKVKSDFGRKQEPAQRPKDDEGAGTYQETQNHAPERTGPILENTDWRAKAMLLSDRVRDLEHDLIDAKEPLVKEIEMWRSKLNSAEGRVRELETSLTQKSQEAEQIAREKEDLTQQGSKAKDLALQMESLRDTLIEKTNLVAEKDGRLAALQEQLNQWMAKAGTNESAIKDHERNLASLQDQVREWTEKANSAEEALAKKDNVLESVQEECKTVQERERELRQKADSLQSSVDALKEELRGREESLKARDEALAVFEKQVTGLAATIQELEPVRQEHAQLSEERETIRKEYETKIAELEVRIAKTDDDHRRYRSRSDRKVAAATRELGEWVRGVEALRQGLQKLVVFLGSESSVPDSEKKALFRSHLNRAANSNGTGKP